MREKPRLAITVGIGSDHGSERVTRVPEETRQPLEEDALDKTHRRKSTKKNHDLHPDQFTRLVGTTSLVTRAEAT